MPRSFNATRSSVDELWTFLADAVKRSQGMTRHGFGPSSDQETMAGRLHAIDPEQLVELMEHGILNAPQSSSVVQHVMHHLWTDTPMHSPDYAMAFLDRLLVRSHDRYPRHFWRMLGDTMPPPLMDDLLLRAVPRMRLPEHVVRPLVEHLPMGHLAWMISREDRYAGRYGSSVDHEALDLLIGAMAPLQRTCLVSQPTFTHDTSVPTLQRFVKHTGVETWAGMASAATSLGNDDARREGLDHLVQALGPEHLAAVMAHATPAEGQAAPTWLATLREHVAQRPAIVAVDDLIREAEVLREMGQSTTTVITGPTRAPRVG